MFWVDPPVSPHPRQRGFVPHCPAIPPRWTALFAHLCVHSCLNWLLTAGTYDEVCAFAREKFGAAFTLFDPISVNGPSTHPVYQWLKASNPDDGKRIEWNFAKFLVDGDGAVVRRYKPGVLPEMIEGDIAALVAGRPLPKRVKPQLGAV